MGLQISFGSDTQTAAAGWYCAKIVLKLAQKDQNRQNRLEWTELVFDQYFHLVTGKLDLYQRVKKLNDFDRDAKNYSPKVCLSWDKKAEGKVLSKKLTS